MREDDVRLVELPAMRVASALGYGTEPERQAAELIVGFAKAIGIKPGDPAYRTFGFNNPNPTPGSPHYGYEMWLVLDPTAPAPRMPEGITIKQIPTSKYAVTRFTGLSNIGRTWRNLVAWFEDSPYTRPPNWFTCLEENTTPTEPDPERWVFDLFLPIAS